MQILGAESQFLNLNKKLTNAHKNPIYGQTLCVLVYSRKQFHAVLSLLEETVYFTYYNKILLQH